MLRIIKDFLVFFALVCLVAGGSFTVQGFLGSNGKPSLQASVVSATVQATEAPPPAPRDQQPVFYINAKSAISVEIDNNQKDHTLITKDANTKLPIASLAKLMTALVVMKRYDLNQEATISNLAIQEVGEQGNLKEGEVLTIEKLVYIMLIESSNRAAHALSEVVGEDTFVVLMNQEAQNLGLQNTHFEDSTGLNKNSYSTIEDLVKLTKHLFFNYSLFREITSLKEYDLYMLDGSLHHKLINTNELLGQDGVIGGKTGYTHEAGGCFMVIQKKSQDTYAIHIVLGAEDRLLEMSKLMNLASWNLKS